MPIVRAMTEPDLPEAWRIVRTAFGTFFGVPDPANFWADRDLVYNRFGAEHIAAFAAEEDDVVVGSNFATRWGSVGFFGPITTRPDLWNRGIAQPLVAAACEAFEGWQLSHQALFTFPHSTKHVHLYGKFGFYPRFLTAIMSAPAQAGPLPDYSRYSTLAPPGRQAAEEASYALTDELYDGLDLRGEIRHVAARNLGDTVLVWDGASRLAGFAVCHWGLASEAGADFLYVKFGAVRSGAGAAERFDTLLDRCSALAAEVGMGKVLAGVNLAHEEAFRQMKTRGFRAEVQGVSMHRGNEAGYSRAGVYVLDDWR
jgi:GNAT superfamily N-acetyltransferase